MMRLYLTVDVDGEKVTPLVGLSTEGYPGMQGVPPTPPDTDTVRRGIDVASKMLGFAEGLRRA